VKKRFEKKSVDANYFTHTSPVSFVLTESDDELRVIVNMNVSSSIFYVNVIQILVKKRDKISYRLSLL